jgi:4-aminobutyrate aminotransferase-like enzyme
VNGDLLPDLRTAVPGPRSRALGRRLAEVECRTITRIDDDGPIFWAESSGANVVDVDGNRFVDLTAGFGVAAAGHSNAAVASAVARQAEALVHAMGDVHPGVAKVELMERLADLAPGDLGVSILSANGSDAVESALKTALLATGRPGVVAFHGSYHGLGYGALAATGMERFRAPFEPQLYPGVRFVSFPRDGGVPAERALDQVRTRVVESGSTPHPVGAVLVEPIQGRGGIVVPPSGFLRGLRELCTEMDVLLVLDEVYTGLGRTGRWFACQHEGVVPDLLVVGKSLAGGLPLSAVIGTPSTMDAWPASAGEALHTSTFLGNPVTCAAALAHLRQIEEGGLVDRARRLGDRVGRRLAEWVSEREWAAGARGRGLMQALVVAGPDPERRAAAAARRALADGILVLPEGDALALTPPLVITEPQLDHALDVLDAALSGSDASG